VTATESYGINWAEVAARAKADVGEEAVERFSGRMRMTALLLQASARPRDPRDEFAPALRWRDETTA
jgi:hypothetical protein